MIRGILGIYICYEIIKAFYKGTPLTINVAIIVSAVVVLFFSMWFMLEKAGILPKVT